MRIKPLQTALLAAGLLSLSPLAMARADAVGLGNFGTDTSGYSYRTAAALNAAGQVAVNSHYFDGSGNYTGTRVFLWSNGTMSNLGNLGTDTNGFGGYSNAVALNAAGQVAGGSGYYDGSGNYKGRRAFLWSNGTMSNLGSLGTDTSGYAVSNALALNAAGQVAGDSYYYDGSGHNNSERAFLWSNGTLSNLGNFGTDTFGYGYSHARALNAAGQVAGYSYYYDGSGNSKGPRAFLWSNGTLINLGSLGTDTSGYGGSSAVALNAAGQVAGDSGYFDGSGNSKGGRAFLWSNGTLINLGSLGTDTSGYGVSSASALNAAGQVAGDSNYYDGSGNYKGYHAFLWSGGVMNNLGTLGGDFSYALALNDSGQVVGGSHTALGNYNFTTHAFLYNAGTMYDLNALAPAGWTFDSASAINVWAQVAGNGTHSGHREAFLITLHPDWQGGNGSWSDASRWNYANMGAFGFTPGTPHDVLINPAASATVYGPSEASVRSLAVSGTGSNLVTLNLNGGSIATQNGTTLGANGTLAGSGRLVGKLAVQNGGRVSVGSYETQQLAGNVNVANGGRIDAQARSGQAGLEIGGSLGNAAGGRVNLLNADVFAHGGTSNSGIISIAGNTTLSGAVDNRTGGQVNVSGVGSQAIFWDNFHNDGSLTVTNSATATFFGLVNGAGNFYGGGAKQFAGGYSPGNSPALTTLSGPISLTGGFVTMELGGTTPGSGHDKTVFGGPVTLSGAGLNVIYWDGWTAGAGQTYDLFDWYGGITGIFSRVSLPTLTNGLAWNTSHLYTTGDISVAAVPEPESYAMMLAGLGLLGVVAKRRSRYP